MEFAQSSSFIVELFSYGGVMGGSNGIIRYSLMWGNTLQSDIMLLDEDSL